MAPEKATTVNQLLRNKYSRFIQRHGVSACPVFSVLQVQRHRSVGNRSPSVSAGLLGWAWHLTHHQDLLQGFLHVLVHLALDSVEEVHPVDGHYFMVLLL